MSKFEDNSVLRTFPGDVLLHEMGLGSSRAFENRFECGKSLRVRGVPIRNRLVQGVAASESIAPEGLDLYPCVSFNGKSPGKVGRADNSSKLGKDDLNLRWCFALREYTRKAFVISIVAPDYNEWNGILFFHAKLREPLKVEGRWKLIAGDSHSSGHAFSLLQAIARSEARVCGLRLLHNSCSQTAIDCDHRGQPI